MHPGIKSAKKRVLITKIKNEKGECITSRTGIAYVFGEFYKKRYENNGQDESEQELGQESQRSRQKSCKLQSTNSKKENPQTATVSEPKTLKHVMTKRGKW